MNNLRKIYEMTYIDRKLEVARMIAALVHSIAVVPVSDLGKSVPISLTCRLRGGGYRVAGSVLHRSSHRGDGFAICL